jgi:hypothetical protein
MIADAAGGRRGQPATWWVNCAMVLAGNVHCVSRKHIQGPKFVVITYGP